jgi:photosystem II stability/assembly factor-like uncharacterized protein
MKFLLFIFLFTTQVAAAQVRWHCTDTKTNASFRGLSVVNDTTAWVSGSKGWVGTSTDGGYNWTMQQVKGFEQCDFRSLYAFDRHTAVIANAGSPAYILRTTDAGSHWKMVYKNEDTAAFIDGIGFWNDREGIIFGDPVNGKPMVLRTADGGETWQELPEDSRPEMEKDEAAFAASGTTLLCLPHHTAMIATGGKTARLLVSRDMGDHWTATTTPMLHGQSTTGIFTMAFSGRHGVIAGGDYKIDSLTKDHVFYTTNNGKSWIKPVTTTGGYRECAVYTDKHTLLAIGPAGADISTDNGKHWKPCACEKQLHTMRKSRNGNIVIAAGGGGKIFVLER